MTNGKLAIGAFLLAGLGAACSSSKGNPTGTAGSSAGGSTGGSTGAAGTGGAGGSTGGSTGTGGSGGGGAAGTVALATPVELVSAQGCGNLRLALANGTIYYTNQLAGTVSSIAVAGGTPTVIAMNQLQPNPIAADATSVYWGNDGDASVMKAPVGGGAASVLFALGGSDGGAPDAGAGAITYPNALLVSGTTLFVGRGLDTYKLPTAGGAAVQLSHSLEIGYPGAFAFDGTHLYQTEISHNAITREVIDGTQKGAITDGTIHDLAPDRIAVSRAALVTDAIQISGQNLVWANGTDIEFHDKDMSETQMTVGRINSAAGFNPLTGFIISDGKIYLGESSDNNVEVTPLTFTPSTNAPPPVVIAMQQPNPAEFAADATNIYYTTVTKNDATGTCKIMKLAK
ncbi:MAG TPA: hypothetical protein VHL80_10620 [Polyangia bacterium]|nr:hypothetical protein [Polyangia bacterium]